ncbi:UTP--glucose-1-phosphate uridylyltransferase GalU [Brevibacterium luteolum]|uniref:UTP--glucose-1-phosphate uridylyltransferase GalU n=1 Tax=Brevibacterium luteolum TaxID=199591 RepID=UPI0021B07D32|nr:UTP--glucose-1-phosphate uridylyltransferase GalU [Brevibacterium luteolum]MCT1873921.1 UTP--glucose-1-phosphate uridylyltransferase GalU [Brevibacterium luteolum]MCT1891245.1 UTP--glucose-1-phosphate uridylyltransferase GalU [Brevibacterium luteolum]MCT1893821.1 UTP--glucose-1-phosphate uridylyltransferase GalU [Brevibacterium luteolum]MCT1923949.1 UTP--glucose-1-phosphate uridylyltransferase GalU [Brevibacterium luteolum]
MTENSNAIVTKAVIPVAGLGTRFLPATKATPKEMLPVVDKPAIQYVVEEAVHAGLNDILMITGRNKRPLEDHFDRVDGLERALEKKGDTKKLAAVQHSSELADIHYVRQGDPLGLGHAVLKSELHVGNEPFAVLLGDDLIDESNPILESMIAVQQATGGSVVALMEVPYEDVGLYGCAAVEDVDIDGAVRITGLVEKPDPSEAPSNLAIIGRYVLAPEIFPVLRNTPPGRGNEIQLTDALQTLAADPNSNGVYGVVFSGDRYDTGDKISYLKAVITLAGRRGDLGDELNGWLREYVAGLDS